MFNKIKKSGYLLVIITNQTWVGMWYYTKKDVEMINKKIQQLLWFNFDWIYACYHHTEIWCNCRKPKTWLVEQAVNELNIDISNSWFIWDKEKDILLGKKIGCKWTILFSENNHNVCCLIKPDFIVDSWQKICKLILNYS